MPDNQDRLPTPDETVDFFTALFRRFVSGVFVELHEPWQAHVRRLCIGAIGGVFYSALRNFVNEGIGIAGLYAMEPSGRKFEVFLGYCVGACMSIFVGGIAAWLSSQRSARVLFLIGMAGVPLFLSLFPNLLDKKTSLLLDDWWPITPAYAQSADKCVGSTAFDKGFKAFFGIREKYDKYAVVVASGRNLADAQAKLKVISAEDPTLKLRVGPRVCDSNYYPVFASDYLPISEARVILEKARQVREDAYLSPGPLNDS